MCPKCDYASQTKTNLYPNLHFPKQSESGFHATYALFGVAFFLPVLTYRHLERLTNSSLCEEDQCEQWVGIFQFSWQCT